MPAYDEQIDIVLNFFTGYYDQGLYFDNLRFIGLCQYIKIAAELCLHTSFLVECYCQQHLKYLHTYQLYSGTMLTLTEVINVTYISTSGFSVDILDRTRFECVIYDEFWCFAAWRYLNSPSLFFFDVVTSVPFSYYDFAIYKVLLVFVLVLL